MPSMLRAAVIAFTSGWMMASGQAADLGASVSRPAPYSEPAGVPCVFEDNGPVIDLPWPSVWLGHFSGGRFFDAGYDRYLEWHDEKFCFPSRLSCDRWVKEHRHAFHQPEGFWTCLPIR